MTTQFGQLQEANLGTEGWGWLAEGLQSHPGLFNSAWVRKDSLDRSKEEDLRVLWDALRPHGFLVVEERVTEFLPEFSGVREGFEKVDGEAAWITLCHVRDLDMMEWIDNGRDKEEEEYEEGEEVEEGGDEGDQEVGEEGIEGQGDEAEDA